MKGFLGIDVSKGYADFCLLDEQFKKCCDDFQLLDNKEGRDLLKGLIAKWLASGLEELFIGVESTGGYENNWYYLIRSLTKTLSAKVVRLNPRAVKKSGEATMTRAVTDQVSAQLISSYLIRFADQIYYADDNEQVLDDYKEGRSMYQFIQMLTKQRVQLNNQLEKLLYSNYSEVLTYCRNGIPSWLLRLLKKYQSGEQVTRAGVERLIQVKGVSERRALGLLKKSSQSERKASLVIRETIKGMVKEMLNKEKEIKKYKALLVGQYKDLKEVELLQSMPGIGVESAVLMILEIGDVNRFESTKKMCSYFGVHPTMKQSGDGEWKSRMSKKGRSAIRARLYMIGLTAIRKIDSIKGLYHRKRKERMNHYAAMGVVMHKILRIIYGMLLSGRSFDQNIDLKNQHRFKVLRSEKKEVMNQPKYRFQSIETDAPISRYQKQKREKQMASQFKET